MPMGEIWPCGVISMIFSPSRTPSARARSTPSTMPNSPLRKSAKEPALILLDSSVMAVSFAGSMPRTITPCTLCPNDSMPCPAT